MAAPKVIYLDYAAATPIDKRVLAAMQPYLTDQFYNPSSAYQPARDVKMALEAARQAIARIFGAKPAEIIFTSGATESVAMAISGSVKEGDHVVTTTVEHAAVIETVKRYSHTLVAVDSRGRVSTGDTAEAIQTNTVVVSVGYTASELGTIQPIAEVAAAVVAVRASRLKAGNKTPLYLHCDASQAAGLLDINVVRLGVDMLTLSAAKCYGPKQVGLLWVRAGIRLQPILYGGGQEAGLRAGTENVAGIIGFARALQLAEKSRKTEHTRLTLLRGSLQEQLSGAGQKAIVSGDAKHRLPSTLSIAWPDIDAERLLYALESRGVLVATGAACAANRGTRSHVLGAIGLSPQLVDGSLRLSLGRFTTKKDITAAATIIKELVAVERTL